MNKYFIYMVIMALVTYLIRMLPITIFQKEMKSPYIKSFLFYMPYAVLSAMTFPAIFSATGNPLSSIMGCICGMLLAYQEKSLLTVAIWTCIVSYMVEVIIHLS